MTEKNFNVGDKVRVNLNSYWWFEDESVVHFEDATIIKINDFNIAVQFTNFTHENLLGSTDDTGWVVPKNLGGWFHQKDIELIEDNTLDHRVEIFLDKTYEISISGSFKEDAVKEIILQLQKIIA